MALADRVKDTSTSIGTGNFTLSGTAPAGFQSLSAIGATGATFGYVIDGGSEWEVGTGTITAANTFSRSPSASSNTGALVNFSAGTKTVFHDVTAAQYAKFQSTNTTAFATAIPLTSPGVTYMPQQTVSAVLAFTVGAGPVQGALVYVALVADGTNAPTFTGFKEWGGSLSYDNRAGIKNQVQFFYDGSDYWYSISQAVGAVAVDTTAPTASSAAVANATPTVVSITHSEAIDPAYVPATSAYTVSGHVVTAVAVSGSNVNLTCSAAFVNGEAARTAAYTQPGTNNARDLAGNLLANFTGLAITNNVGAVATGATMTGPSGGAVSVASTNITLAITPTGSTVTGTVRYTFNDTSGGGSFSPAFLDLTTGGPSGTTQYTPSATAGARTLTTTNNGGLSNPSLTYTSTAAGTYVRLSPKTSYLAESGTGPYTYTPDQARTLDENCGVTSMALQSGVDGSLTVTATGAPGLLMGLQTTNAVTPYTGMLLYGYGGNYAFGGTGGTQTASLTAASGDLVRLRRFGSIVVMEVARTATPTTFVEVIRWTGVSTGVLYFTIESSSSVVSNFTQAGLA